LFILKRKTRVDEKWLGSKKKSSKRDVTFLANNHKQTDRNKQIEEPLHSRNDKQRKKRNKFYISLPNKKKYAEAVEKCPTLTVDTAWTNRPQVRY